MAKKNPRQRRKPGPARAAAQAFTASVAAAEFLAICFKAARRGQNSSPAAPEDSATQRKQSENSPAM